MIWMRNDVAWEREHGRTRRRQWERRHCVAPPGSKYTLGTLNLDQSVGYRPEATFVGKPGFTLQVFNALNEDEPLQRMDVTSETAPRQHPKPSCCRWPA